MNIKRAAGLFAWLLLAVIAFDPAHAARDDFEIDLVGARGGQLRCGALDDLAELQIVVGGLGSRAQQLDERVGEAGADRRDGRAARMGVCIDAAS